MSEITITLDHIAALEYRIKRAIFELDEKGYKEGLMMSMPHYIYEMFKRRHQEVIGASFIPEDAVGFYSGCRIVPAYENKITVYHPFMLPQFPELVKSIEI